MSMHPISIRVNGVNHTVQAEPRTTLLDLLRDQLGQVGAHNGCEHGVCGACTVLLDGRSVRSCLLFAVQADGADVLTVEGLGEQGELGPLQHAFWENHALQCGFCTPGMLLRAHELLADNPRPTRAEVRAALAGNLCRCTGYQYIVDAVLDAADRLAQGEPEPDKQGSSA